MARSCVKEISPPNDTGLLEDSLTKWTICLVLFDGLTGRPQSETNGSKVGRAFLRSQKRTYCFCDGTLTAFHSQQQLFTTRASKKDTPPCPDGSILVLGWAMHKRSVWFWYNILPGACRLPGVCGFKWVSCGVIFLSKDWSSTHPPSRRSGSSQSLTQTID